MTSLISCICLCIGILFSSYQQPVPTHAVYINGEKNTAYWIEGSYEKPDGKIIEIERHQGILPANWFVNADCHLKLKIESEKLSEVMVFYEYHEIKEWISSVKGTKYSIDIPARNQ